MLSPLESYVQKHLRFNFAIGLLDGGFFGLGMGFASFSAIIPLFVHHLTNSALLIGLVPAIHNLGWQLPQLFMAGLLGRVERYKPLTLQMTVHERLPFLGLAGIALLVPSSSKTTILALTFLMLIWQGFGAGLAANPWTNMVSKVIPGHLLGTFFGTQSAAFNGLAGLSAIIAGLILDRVLAPWNFSLCFALTFVFMVGSFIALAMTREARSAPKTPETVPLWDRSMSVLRCDVNFRAFLAVRVLSQFGGMAFAFYVIYAVQQFGMSDAAAGVMVAILLLGQVVLSPVMGRLGDRWSHRGVMIAGAFAAALSAILAWKATSVSWFYAIFILEAVAVIATFTIPLVMSVSFAPRHEERPLYVGMANTLPAPATILAPVLGGWLADQAGFHVTFVLSALFALAMAAALLFLVKDPAAVRRAQE
ncbi:MAG TPA: MFS transporter, partial [Anaerolineales bacterium]|nr:MFS transporter [Anaerolineales bacterium]